MNFRCIRELMVRVAIYNKWLVLAVFVCAYLSGRSAFAKKTSNSSIRTMTLVHVGRTPSPSLSLQLRNGRLHKPSWTTINHFLRCHHTNTVGRIDRELIDRLIVIAEHFKSRTIHVISGYRHKTVARQKGTSGSFHCKGMAIDIKIPGVSTRALVSYIKNKYSGGLGYYPGSFVHIDTRKESVNWMDVSKNGQKPRYVAWNINYRQRRSKHS